MSEKHVKGSGLSWFIRRGNTVRGPFSSARIRHYVIEGRLQLDDEVSLDRSEWQRLGSVNEVVPLQMRGNDEAELAQQSQQRRTERLRAIRAIAIAVVVMVALVGIVLLAGRSEERAPIDCTAPAAPAVAWEGCRLSGADLRGVRLDGAHLANADLAGSRLGEAGLRDADMRYVDLAGADLSYAVLRGAVLKGANLRHADLTNADLTGADLSFADLGGARVGGAVFGNTRLEGAIWVDGKACSDGNCPR
ncbi:MAG: pentapeptide repeat-containing protein [Gammaproteobacteria bacterium]|nr:pentapeptide repeat-containing protein [Gammaproteobacteria bacterium]